MNGVDELLEALSVLIDSKVYDNDAQRIEVSRYMHDIARILRTANECLGFAWMDIGTAWGITQQTVKAILGGIYENTLKFSNSTVANELRATTTANSFRDASDAYQVELNRISSKYGIDGIGGD